MKKATRRILVGLTALIAVSTLSVMRAPQSLAAGTQDFTLHNKTGYTIRKLWIAPSTTTDWEEQLLPEPLKNGEDVDIEFDPKEKAEKWDIKVEWEKGDDAEWHTLKLNDITDVTLHWTEKDGAWAIIE